MIEHGLAGSIYISLQGYPGFFQMPPGCAGIMIQNKQVAEHKKQKCLNAVNF